MSGASLLPVTESTLLPFTASGKRALTRVVVWCNYACDITTRRVSEGRQSQLRQIPRSRSGLGFCFENFYVVDCAPPSNPRVGTPFNHRLGQELETPTSRQLGGNGSWFTESTESLRQGRGFDDICCLIRGLSPSLVDAVFCGI